MLTYLIILLDDTSATYCSLTPGPSRGGEGSRYLMPLDVLKRGIVWAMKENLNIQFVYPDYRLPEEYREAVESIDHTKIGPVDCGEDLDVVVVEDISKVEGGTAIPCIWRCTLDELNHQKDCVKELLGSLSRLNIMLTDIPTWKQAEFDTYKAILEELADHIVEVYRQGKSTQLNLLTDRLILNEMNNCGAGDSCVTLAPDGRFYVCPAFYYAGAENVGSLTEGLTIPNRQLFRLDHAPICRACDAWQCRRCVWQNAQLTGDVNTPSHEQCVAAHLERNASRLLQQKLYGQGFRLEGSREIREIDYLDPFNIVNRWK